MATSETIREQARDIPIYRRCDVLVVGGGPAGTAAAACAAKLNADTVLVERYGYLGGMSTGGFVLYIDRQTDWQGNRVVAGFAAELLGRLPQEAILGPPKEVWGSQEPVASTYWRERHNAFHGIVTYSPSIDPEWLKIASFDVIRERNVTMMLHCWGTAPIMEGSEIRGIIFESKEGRKAVLAKIVIDATGDGDIFASAGAAFESDQIASETHATMNLAFRWAGCDFNRYLNFQFEDPDAFRAVIARGVEMGVSERPYVSPRPDVVYFMAPKLRGYSCLSIKDLTHVEVLSRQLMVKILDFYRKNMPGFESAYIMDTAPQMGVRHSRRLVGVKRVERAEWVAGKVHDDEIGLCPAPTPVHPTVSVPLGCLTPATLDGLLVAGRNLSCDPASHNFLREIPYCWMMGQAAGVTAAMAVNSGVRVRDVDVKAVQRELAKQGVPLRQETATPCQEGNLTGQRLRKRSPETQRTG
jgi:hypothetical protein